MSLTMKSESSTKSKEIEYVTFRAGDVLMGIDIHQVEEINRLVEVTRVPHAPKSVRGVINLRGNVITVVGLRTILGLPAAEITGQSRTVIVHSQEEQIGLLVDQIGDVVKARSDALDPPPANLDGIDGRLFKGVYKLDTELLVLLDVEAVLSVKSQAA